MGRLNLTRLVTLFGTVGFARDAPKAKVSLNHAYARFNPQNRTILKGSSLNGGGGAYSHFFSRMIGVKAEFEG